MSMTKPPVRQKLEHLFLKIRHGPATLLITYRVANSTNDQLSVRFNHVCAVLQRLPNTAKAGYNKELEYR